MAASIRFITLVLVLACLTGCDSERVSVAKAAVRDQMRDPGAVEFRNVRDTGEVICGEVNAKNGFGAYVGFRPFYATGAYPSRPKVVREDDDRAYANWLALCR